MSCVMTSLQCFTQINFFNNFFFSLQRSKNIVKTTTRYLKSFKTFPSSLRRQIKLNNMCKIQNEPQPVRKNTKDVSTKLNCQLNLKPKEGIFRARRLLRLVYTEQLQQQICRVPAGRLLVQHQHLLKAGCRNGALQPETTQEMKQPALACAIQCHLTSQRYHQSSRWARSSSTGRWTTSSPIHHPHQGCIEELLWLG